MLSVLGGILERRASTSIMEVEALKISLKDKIQIIFRVNNVK